MFQFVIARRTAVALAVAALLGLASPASAGEAVPFKGSLDGDVTHTSVDAQTDAVLVEATGAATQLGRFAVSVPHLVDLPTRTAMERPDRAVLTASGGAAPGGATPGRRGYPATPRAARPPATSTARAPTARASRPTGRAPTAAPPATRGAARAGRAGDRASNPAAGSAAHPRYRPGARTRRAAAAARPGSRPPPRRRRPPGNGAAARRRTASARP